jgi:hypothetical protein
MSLDSDKSEYSDCESDNLLEEDSDNGFFG